MVERLDAYWDDMRAIRDRNRQTTRERIQGDPIRQLMSRLGCCHADDCTHPSCQCDVVAVTELARLKASL